MRVLEYARSEFLFEGPIISLSAEELFFGYETTIVDKLNTGSISQGNVYYDSHIKPVYLGNNTLEDEFKVVTGNNITNLTDAHRDTGLIKGKNGLEWNSFKWPLWTGKAFINTTSDLGDTEPLYFE